MSGCAEWVFENKRHFDDIGILVCSDVLEEKVLVSRRLQDKNQSLVLETKSLETLKTFASMINLFSIYSTVNLRIACTE